MKPNRFRATAVASSPGWRSMSCSQCSHQDRLGHSLRMTSPRSLTRLGAFQTTSKTFTAPMRWVASWRSRRQMLPASKPSSQSCVGYGGLPRHQRCACRWLPARHQRPRQGLCRASDARRDGLSLLEARSLRRRHDQELEPEVLVYHTTEDGSLELGAVEWVVPKTAWEAAYGVGPRRQSSMALRLPSSIPC